MKVVGIIASVIMGILLLVGISWGMGMFDEVANTERALGSYEQFFNRCAAVQSLETQRDQLEAQLEATDPEDTDEVSRLRSALTGVESQRARAINRYNADATNLSREIFMSERLPQRLDVNAEQTTCAL